MSETRQTHYNDQGRSVTRESVGSLIPGRLEEQCANTLIGCSLIVYQAIRQTNYICSLSRL